MSFTSALAIFVITLVSCFATFGFCQSLRNWKRIRELDVRIHNLHWLVMSLEHHHEQIVKAILTRGKNK
jgi:hypothetical protein